MMKTAGDVDGYTVHVIGEDKCVWVAVKFPDEAMNFPDIAYETDCGGAFWVPQDPTKEYYRYCPFCGRKIKFEEANDERSKTTTE